ncbi:PilE-like protein [Elusimicrobium minutum Pei191]|uniref:PilE-like protein n=1 Tax=Elusimicrobium minutum (strain Pei191) TaxID=445932 RepID=B2KEX5_ELUMP|nr:prepilin-type N-terminal cleavage/methylation domain-containing protein [Elusimicrobium minutum]ACC99071.1 PilE-like protein [Elusimicrobium minutum Pei191]
MKKGFTLIELLVVVLIIGILAAIALPQYQKAVEKSRSAEALILLKAIYESAERYNLATGLWPQSSEWDVLDISLDNLATGTYSGYITRDSKNFQYIIVNDTISIQPFDNSWAIGRAYPGFAYSDEAVRYFRCIPKNEKGEKFCKSLGWTKQANGWYLDN